MGKQVTEYEVLAMCAQMVESRKKDVSTSMSSLVPHWEMQTLWAYYDSCLRILREMMKHFRYGREEGMKTGPKELSPGKRTGQADVAEGQLSMDSLEGGVSA